VDILAFCLFIVSFICKYGIGSDLAMLLLISLRNERTRVKRI